MFVNAIFFLMAMINLGQKAKAKPKPQDLGKTLDLVVSDKELEQIINPPPNNTKPIDPKLEAFLKAFQK